MFSFLSVKFWLGAIAAAFIAGFASGAWVIWKWWDIAEMSAQIERMKEDSRKIEAVLGINKRLDDEGIEADKRNEEILHEILGRYGNPSPDEGSSMDKPPSRPDSNHIDSGDADPVCVDADGMRDIGRIQ